MLRCEGYKMFHGTMRVESLCGARMVTGVWPYRPDTDCWYCKGESVPADNCMIYDDHTEEAM